MDYANLSDSELDSMVAKKLSTSRAPNSNDDFANMSDAEIDSLVSAKLSGESAGSLPDPTLPEADLGFVTRSQYALEPIQSNREALLKQKFGDKNVVADENGDLFVNQNGYLRPVNAPGFGMTDLAEMAGALPETVPEIAGAMVGGVGGFAAGAPTGPGAFGTGAMGVAAGRAVGSGAGSIFRQALSSAVGTPQVATIGERAMETGISTIAGPVGGAIADAALPYAKQLPGIRKILGGSAKTSEKAPQILSQDISLELTPIASDAVEAVTYPREVVDQQLAKLKDIATKQGLPEPTYAQAAGGKAILAEGKLMETPLIGGRVRAQVDKQLKAVRGNLEKITGKFIDAESSAYEVGLATKELAQTNERAQKQMAQELYQKVDELGKDAMVGKRTFSNKYRDFAGKHGLINPDLSPAEYAADTALTESEFGVLQKTIFNGIKALEKTKSPKIRFESVNALVKTAKATAKELKTSSPNASRILNEFVDELNGTAERMLNRESPKLGEVFGQANKNWKTYKDYQGFNKKIFSDGMGEEKVVKKLMSDSAKIEGMKKVIGNERVRDIGISFVKDILEPLSKSGVARSDSAISALKKNSAQIKAAIGDADYDNLIENLYYLNRTNQPLNISRASLYSLFDETKGGLKGFAARVVGSAKTYSEATGKPLSAPIRKALSPVGDLYDATIGKGVTKGTAGNILSAPFREDIQMKNTGGKFIRTGENEKKENGRSPSTKFTRKNP